jgi:hypothetical protein
MSEKFADTPVWSTGLNVSSLQTQIGYYKCETVDTVDTILRRIILLYLLIPWCRILFEKLSLSLS